MLPLLVRWEAADSPLALLLAGACLKGACLAADRTGLLMQRDEDIMAHILLHLQVRSGYCTDAQGTAGATFEAGSFLALDMHGSQGVPGWLPLPAASLQPPPGAHAAAGDSAAPEHDRWQCRSLPWTHQNLSPTAMAQCHSLLLRVNPADATFGRWVLRK